MRSSVESTERGNVYADAVIDSDPGVADAGKMTMSWSAFGFARGRRSATRGSITPRAPQSCLLPVVLAIAILVPGEVRAQPIQIPAGIIPAGELTAASPPTIAVGVGSGIVTYRYSPLTDEYLVIWESEPTGRFDFQNADTHWQPSFGDPDGDGETELVSVDQWMLHVWGDRGAGSINAEISSIPFTHAATAVADADGDGRDEILVGWKNQLMIWTYDGTELSRRTALTVSGGDRAMIWNINVANLDADPRPEIVAGGTLTDGRMHVLQILEYEDGELRLETSVPVEWYADVTRVYDWDGDGRPEIFTTGNSQRILGLRYDERSGTYRPFWRSRLLDGFIQGLAFGDIDRDSHPEIVAGTYVYADRHDSPPGLSIFSDPGTGVPELVYQIESPQVGYPGLILRDLDADSRLELLVNGSRLYEIERGAGGSWLCSHTRRLGAVEERPGEVQPNAAVAAAFTPSGQRETSPLVLVQHLVVTAGGTGRILGIGQNVQLALRAENVGWEAHDLIFRLRCDDPRVTLLADTWDFGFLNADATVENIRQPFQMRIAPGAEPGDVTLHIDVLAGNGRTFTRTFTDFRIDSFLER